MNKIYFNYEGISNDISVLTNNVKNICDSLDKLNNINYIVPESWQSNGAVKFREDAQNSLIDPINAFEEILAGLIKLVVESSDNFSNLENIIGNDLYTWYNNKVENGLVFDFFNDNIRDYIVNYLKQNGDYDVPTNETIEVLDVSLNNSRDYDLLTDVTSKSPDITSELSDVVSQETL